MNSINKLDAQVNQLAVRILVVAGPDALTPFVARTRFDKMTQELNYAIRHTSKEDMAALMGHLARDGGSALVRRVAGLWELVKKLSSGTANELEGMFKAYSADNLSRHIARRLGNASAITTGAISRGATTFTALVRDLTANPSEAAPKLLVLVFASVAASGGIDGNGGLPDTDIPLMGIGAHRSPFTHSIIIG